MQPVVCDKCKRAMTKKGVLFMSNSKFEVYKCSCGNEKKICLGLGQP